MLRKSLFSFVLITSVACFGQVATTGGYATTAGPAVVPVSAANAPLVATPHVALPGSGPAVGAPISNENDSRGSAGPSVANPNGNPLAVENAANATAAGSTAETTTSATGTVNAATANAGTNNAEPFEFGVQGFGSPSPGARSSVTSLGEIARYYRSHRRQAVRTFNNASIAQLTTTGLPFAPLGSTPVVAVSTSSSGTLMAQNQPPALPQNDQDNAPLQNDRAAQSSTAFQQRHAAIQNAAATDQKQEAATNANSGSNSSPASSSPKAPAKLPQTGSPLPLLLVLGGAGLVGGTLWLLRR